MMNRSPREIELEVTIESMGYANSTTPLIRDLALQASAGEILGLLGPSGLGKTTLLRIIAGLEKRYRGEVKVGGIVKNAPGPDVQLVFQECRLLPWMNARENVLFALREPHSNADREAAVIALSNVGLAGKEERWPRELSGGEIARVALARAFLGSPSVLLLDEPFANVDIKVRSELHGLVIRAARDRGVCVVFVTHSIEDAVCLSDRIVVANSRPLGRFWSHEIDAAQPRSLFSESLREVVLDIERQLRNEE